MNEFLVYIGAGSKENLNNKISNYINENEYLASMQSEQVDAIINPNPATVDFNTCEGTIFEVKFLIHK